MAEFARFGALKDLTRVIDTAAYKQQTVPTFIDLGTVDDKLVGVFIKATLKGLIWYNPKRLHASATRPPGRTCRSRPADRGGRARASGATAWSRRPPLAGRAPTG